MEKNQILQELEKERANKEQLSIQFKKELEQQKIDDENNSKASIEAYKMEKLKEKSKELSNKWYIKLYLFFRSFNKNFDKKEFLWNKASNIMKIYDIPYSKTNY